MNTTPYKNRRSGKAFAGMILIVAGLIFLLNQMGLYLPHWLFSWPMFLIIIGLYTGSRNDFKNPSAYIMIAIGGFFLVDKIIPSVNFFHIFWPVILIGLGVYMILSKERKNQLADSFRGKRTHPLETAAGWDKAQEFGPEPLGGQVKEEAPFSSAAREEDFVDSVSVFGSVKKNIMSKNFKGGDIVNFFGGAEINLIQADITGPVILDVTQVFGGTKIIVPAHWEIHSEMAAIFGGIEDKRPIHMPQAGSGKVLTIRGTSIFGGIDIRSF